MQNLTVLEPYLGTELIGQIHSFDPVMVSGGILLLAVVVAVIVLAVLKVITAQAAKRTKLELDEKLLETLHTPLFRLIMLGGLYLAILNLELSGAIAAVILNMLLTIGYLIVILFAIRALDVFIKYGIKTLTKKTQSMLDDEIIPIFHNTTVVIIWAFGLILILGVWGVDVAPFLAGLGIAGLAVSFAIQPTLSNVFSGVSLILDKVFKVGDKIQLDSGEVGIVHEISLRSTRIRTFDNELIVLPNDSLASAKIKNYTQPDFMVRVVVPFSVEYGTKPDKVIKLIEDSIRKNIDDVLEDPPIAVTFSEMGESSLNFHARFWVANYGDAYGKKLEATDLIYKELNKSKIGIPFPTRTVYLEK
jgi:MscS family membrane protein